MGSSIRHANKIKMIPLLNFDGNEASTATQQVQGRHQAAANQQKGSRCVSFYYDYDIAPYVSVMVDIMNHICTRGTDGRRGNAI